MKIKKIFGVCFVTILIMLFFCCSPKSDTPNIRTEPGIEFCNPACAKMTQLYKDGDQSCLLYIEDIIVDGEKMNCVQFCEYEMNNSIQLNPKCIYEEINSCAEIPEKCEE